MHHIAILGPFRLAAGTIRGLLLAAALLGAVATAQDRRNLAITPVPTEAAANDKRVALVIGNSSYQKGPLKNPVNDAADMAAKLRALGFDVIERTDIKTSQIGRTLREFRSRLSPGSVALFFYAGHGLQIKGENYLPAVDADIEGEEDAPNQSIAVRQVMDIMEDAKTRMNLAFLDACRNNPYARSFRSGADGLARVSAPSGTLISFATRPGSVAADGAGRNGLYTTHLLKAIETPNQPVELMLKQVTSGVKVASRGMQEPWMEGSIEGDFQFRTVAVQQEAVVLAAEAEKARRDAVERAVQEAVRRNAEQEAAKRAALEVEQRATTERAVQEALRRSNEQAARERAELQASMQKIIEQALARQNSLIEEQGGRKAEAQPAPAATVVASLGPATATAVARRESIGALKAARPGDEWEYLAREEIFGKQRKLLWRVKVAHSTSGVLEELIVDGKSIQEWVFRGQPEILGAPIESRFIFGPHWNGTALPALPVHGFGECVVKWRCELSSKVVGQERITVPAGTFDTIRIDGTLRGSFTNNGVVSIWYSESDRRLVKQTFVIRASGIGFVANETVELQAVRPASP